MNGLAYGNGWKFNLTTHCVIRTRTDWEAAAVDACQEHKVNTIPELLLNREIKAPPANYNALAGWRRMTVDPLRIFSI